MNLALRYTSNIMIRRVGILKIWFQQKTIDWFNCNWKTYLITCSVKISNNRSKNWLPYSPERPRNKKSPSKTGRGIDVSGTGTAKIDKAMRTWAKTAQSWFKIRKKRKIEYNPNIWVILKHESIFSNRPASLVSRTDSICSLTWPSWIVSEISAKARACKGECGRAPWIQGNPAKF